MSISHFLTVTVDVEFIIALNSILERGSEEGCGYFLDDFPANIDEVAKKFTNPTAEDIDNGGPSVLVSYSDTTFTLWIRPLSNKTEVHIGCIGFPWKKEYWNSSDTHKTYIDLARYARLLLDLCDSFSILAIESDAV